MTDYAKLYARLCGAIDEVLDELGTIPEDGTTCDITIGRLEIHVQSVADHQMEVALVHVLPKENTGDDDDDEDEETRKRTAKGQGAEGKGQRQREGKG